MEKRKKEYFDHALDRAISRTRRILDDLKFIREMNREGKKDVVYNFTLPTAEEAEFLIRNTRELILSQKTPTGEEDLQRIIDATYPVEIGFNAEGWFGVRIPLLIPKKDNYSVKYLEKRLGPALDAFWRARPRQFLPSNFNSVIVFRHIYSPRRPGWERCVPADSEIDCVIRLFFTHVLHQMFPIDFRHYHCCVLGEEECTEVYLMPISDFGKWLAQETPYLVVSPKGEKLYETIAAAREAQNEDVRKESAVTQ